MNTLWTRIPENIVWVEVVKLNCCSALSVNTVGWNAVPGRIQHVGTSYIGGHQVPQCKRAKPRNYQSGTLLRMRASWECVVRIVRFTQPTCGACIGMSGGNTKHTLTYDINDLLFTPEAKAATRNHFRTDSWHCWWMEGNQWNEVLQSSEVEYLQGVPWTFVACIHLFVIRLDPHSLRFSADQHTDIKICCPPFSQQGSRSACNCHRRCSFPRHRNALEDICIRARCCHIRRGATSVRVDICVEKQLSHWAALYKNFHFYRQTSDTRVTHHVWPCVRSCCTWVGCFSTSLM